MLDVEKIRTLREKAGLTLEAAAEKAEFSNRQQWHLIESGRRADVQLSTLDKMARALGCKPRDLLK